MPTPRPAPDADGTSAPTGAVRRLTRRDALRGAGLLGALAVGGSLGGCGLRLERSAPHVPLLPSARPYPGGDALRAELARCRAAREAAQVWSEAGGPALSRNLIRVHTAQVEALQTRLAQVHEPVTSPAGAPSEGPSSGPASSGPTARPSATAGTPRATSAATTDPAQARAALLSAERQALDGAWLAGAPAADRVLLGGCLVARSQAARLLGAPALPSPKRPRPATPEQAAGLLRVLYPVLYGLEVATARVVVAGAPRAQAARASLAGVRRQRQFLVQAAGSSAPPPHLGYEVPEPVSSPAAADALARDLLGDLSDAYVRGLGEVGELAEGSSDDAGEVAPAVASLLAWARETEGWRGTWGAGPRALPAS